MKTISEALADLRAKLYAQRARATARPEAPWQRALFVPVRLGWAVIQDFLGGQLTLRAMSLVYTTLLSLVPLLAISFSVLKGFGAHNKIEPFLLQTLAPLGEKGVEITKKIIEFVDRIEVGVLGFVGILLLFYTVVSLLQKVERALNYIWHVPTERSIPHKVRDYLLAVMLGPILVIGATAIIASLMSTSIVQSITAIGPLGHLVELAGKMTSLVMVVGAFTFIYTFLPNTAVRIGPALIGGITAGVMWSVIGWGFASFIVNSAKYTVIYSAFATLILFMIWLYLVWLIVLLGSAVSFYAQNPHYMGIRRESARFGIALTEKVALVAAHAIVRTWYQGGDPWSADRLARATGAPMPVLARVLETLEAGGLIERAGDNAELFLPARPPEDTPVKDVLDAVRRDEGTGHPPSGLRGAPQAVDDIIARLDQANAAELSGLTLKDFALGGEAPEGSAPARKPPGLRSA
ncbi:MAG: YihY family inner membrane protein [Alphaproteobacteria bacterium]|nr:YihY family inner membrane protein [Alphaproteobacteria bacterium]